MDQKIDTKNKAGKGLQKKAQRIEEKKILSYTSKMEIKDKIKKELKSLEKVFERKPKYDLIELPWIDCAEDPVRPDLDLAFRQAYGRKIFGLRDEDKDIAAIICFAFTNQVPKTIEEMDSLSKDAAMQAIHRAGVQGHIAIAYTVWAKKKGGGRAIVNEVYKMIKRSSHLHRLVTLSPLTDMARNFHLKNGAKELQVNETSQNFEYDIELEQWEKYLDRAKKWVKI